MKYLTLLSEHEIYMFGIEEDSLFFNVNFRQKHSYSNSEFLAKFKIFEKMRNHISFID